MPRDRNTYIIKQGQKRVRKVYRRTGQKLTYDQLRHQRIQEMSFWRRMLLVMVGLLTIGVAIYIYTQFTHWSAWLVGLIGFIFLYIGLRGRKSSLEDLSNGLGDSAGHALIDAILEGVF